MGRRKPFIAKNEGVKFHLVHRSQKDPLYLNENLGEHVLVPADDDASQELVDLVNGNKTTNKPMSLSMSKNRKNELDEKRLEEQMKYGVYYEDDYDYLQHLKEVDVDDEVANMEKSVKGIKINSVIIKDNSDDDDDEDDNKIVYKNKLNLPSTVCHST
jgi:hypothetical protein